MRVGKNPNKRAPALPAYGLHRLILPVHIPNQEGYFAQSLDILKLCLESVRLTKAPGTAVTLIANGCDNQTLELLITEHSGGWIDQLVIHAQNRGKIDAIVGAARSCFEEVVTFSDSDVLFRPGWDTAIETLFRTFPECGFVSPFPNPDEELRFTSSVFVSSVHHVSLEHIEDHSSLDRYNASVGRAPTSADVRGCLVIRRDGATACVGGGHFVCSVRRRVLRSGPFGPSLEAISSDSDRDWLDAPPDRLGYWRLATHRAYVQHMGNRPEAWMRDEVSMLTTAAKPTPATPSPLPPLRAHWTALLPYAVRARVGLRFGRFVRHRLRPR